MLSRTIYNSNAITETGSETVVSTKETVIGVCTCEVVGTGSNKPTVTVQGKLFKSTDASVDSGWVDIVTFSNVDDDSVVGRAIGVFTFMRAVVTGNTDQKQIQVSVGYNG